MKLLNLLEQLDTKEKVFISETTVLVGNFKDEKRIVLNRENSKVVLAESAYDFYKYKEFVGREVLAEIYPTTFSKVITEEGTLEQVRIYLEELI